VSYTDPSGFFFKAIGSFIGKFWQPILAIGITVVSAGVATGALFASLEIAGTSAAWGVAIGGGALAGLVNAGNLRGALYGAFSAAAFHGVGTYFSNIRGAAAKNLGRFGNFVKDNLRLTKTIAHGLTGGIMNELQGGKFAHGFLSAGATQALAPEIDGIGIGDGALSFGDRALRVASAAALGGAVSEITGGKFANGAVTGAFSRAFNDEIQYDDDKLSALTADERYQITDEQRQLAMDGERRAFWESRLASGDPIAPLALEIIDNVGLGRAANEWLKLNARRAGVEIDLDQIGVELMNRHVEFTDQDPLGRRGLLNPRQVAEFHHLVFGAHGLPPTAFGGTPFTGQLYEADITRDIWCRGCDR